jgi:hypothetical protein
MRAFATEPTRRDVETAIGLVDALTDMARSRKATHTAEALAAYGAELRALEPKREFEVIGRDNYAWRLEHSLLLPWTPEELLAHAEADLRLVDARLASLPPKRDPPPATEAQKALARSYDRATHLALYDAMEESLRAATVAGGWVTIPDGVGPLRARETPEAMIPLTGDGGSMNSPPTFGDSDVGWWNVDHWKPDMPEAARVERIVNTQSYAVTRMGPYAAHEGFPGHHLQLAIARLLEDPLRSVVGDSVQIEGWGLYAEEALFVHGGLGYTTDAERLILGSYRHRIRRVIFDVNIETGAWSLQQAADFKHGTAPGEGKVDEEILRSIQWPTQLVSYYAGKKQIVALREEYARRRGATYDERAFHDAFLAEGSIPVALIRAAMLDEPVPAFQ